jgi:hypothetical protein
VCILLHHCISLSDKQLPCATLLLSAPVVHEGAFLPFSAAAASYKSSETESSGMESTEEDTISCRAAGTTGGISSRGKENRASCTIVCWLHQVNACSCLVWDSGSCMLVPMHTLMHTQMLPV